MFDPCQVTVSTTLTFLNFLTHINKEQPKSLGVKGVPAVITDDEFKEFLDLNKIAYAKAEYMESKKDGRVLRMFRYEINSPTEAKALISQNLVCQVTGIVYEVEEFRSPISVQQCYNCQSCGHPAKTVGQNKNVLSAERIIHTKDAQIEKPGNQNVLTVRGHMLRLTKSVQVSRIQRAGIPTTCDLQAKSICLNN